MKELIRDFWGWYEQHHLLNVGIAAGLFIFQLIHLYWLTAHVVWMKVFDLSHFELNGVGRWLIIIVDYTEIPALVTTSLVYINELRKVFSWKSVCFLFFLNTQWLHILWITDEFIVSAFGGDLASLPVWLAWVAIGIDYLELPVIFDTLRKFSIALQERKVRQFMREEL